MSSKSRIVLGEKGASCKETIIPPIAPTVVGFRAWYDATKNMNNDLKYRIFRKTDGHCHLTGTKLIRKNYAKFGAQGGWEIEHSTPQAKGGTNHINNLYPALISANRSKQDSANAAIRSQYGLTRAPFSREQKEKVRNENAWTGLGLGALAGLPFGPVGVGICALIGALFGSNSEVK